LATLATTPGTARIYPTGRCVYRDNLLKCFLKAILHKRAPWDATESCVSELPDWRKQIALHRAKIERERAQPVPNQRLLHKWEKDIAVGRAKSLD
jgi:hypothetical protein